MREQIHNYQLTNEALRREVEALRQQSQRQPSPVKQEGGEWKQKYEELYEETIRYKEQINYLNFQVLDLRKKSSPVKELREVKEVNQFSLGEEDGS